MATNTTCLYSIKNYTSTLAHPPLIGYSMDGFPLYGRYLDSAAPGASTALDPCGGHTHSGVAGGIADSVVGYHYHSQVVQINSTAGTYLAYPAGPYQCWKGNISAITHFFDTGGGSSNGFTGATGPPARLSVVGASSGGGGGDPEMSSCCTCMLCLLPAPTSSPHRLHCVQPATAAAT